MAQIKIEEPDQPTRKQLMKIRGKDLKPVKTKAKWGQLGRSRERRSSRLRAGSNVSVLGR